MGLFAQEPDKAKFKKLKEEGCVVSLSVEVPRPLVERQTQDMLVRIQQRAKIPGFRPGKAPLELVKKNFSGHAQEETLDALIRRYTPEALKELNVKPVAVPSVDKVSFEPGKPVRFRVRVEVSPLVSPKDYAKLAVQSTTYPADDKAVAARLEELREAHARLEKAAEEAVGPSHYVVIDYQASREGKPLAGAQAENELVDMSSDQTIAGLIEGLSGMRRGQAKELAITLEGKPTSLRVQVKEIKTKILPALDEEFAKDMDCESLEALKAKLRQVIEEEGKTRSERELARSIEEALLKSNRFPVPPALAQEQLERILDRLRRQTGGEPSAGQLEELKKKLLPRAEDEVRLGYLLPAIADKEKLSVGEEELKAELERNLAAAEPGKKEELRSFFDERKDSIAAMLRDRKALQFVRDHAAITEVAARA
ncbi:MAG: trigger factor [Elusimicrobia bacterium]|nr:trigger factor [Elusimicrobiota bacterium]MDE2424787.1 trigger factor [Elusimicrobiota bacterium]